ncbi:MAG TPA: ROK family transcriptional regulator [Mycobacteriales bacterium]|nr:ROK family transcriptional regulator [Mycobacteriales bacterium]
MADVSGGPAQRIVQALRERGALSRPELQAETGLSRGAVTTAAAVLCRQGLVHEAEPRLTGALGRPAVVLRLDRRAGLAVGLDIGKRHVRVAVADLAQEVLGERREEIEPDLSADAVLDLAVALVDAVLQESGCDRTMIVGAGLAVPGPVHGPTGELGSATILPGWVGVRPRAEVYGRLGVPVLVDNDANVGALAEWTWGAGQGVTDLAYVKVATGIGCGLILNGRPFRGAGGTAGEIGHLPVMPNGPVCRCGNRGCLETVAGAEAVRDLLRPVLGDVEIASVARRAQEGDLACRRVMADTGTLIGQAVASLVNLVNPRRLVIGGPFAAVGDVLLDPLRQAVLRSAIPSAAAELEVVPSALAERAEVLGAVALVLHDPQIPIRT